MSVIVHQNRSGLLIVTNGADDSPEDADYPHDFAGLHRVRLHAYPNEMYLQGTFAGRRSLAMRRPYKPDRRHWHTMTTISSAKIPGTSGSYLAHHLVGIYMLIFLQTEEIPVVQSGLTEASACVGSETGWDGPCP